MRNLKAIKKALSVATGGGLVDYLPAPLAREVIKYVRDINIMRRLIRVFNQPSRNWNKPKRATGMDAYFIPDGVTATQSQFTGSKVTWEAKKLMSYVLVDEEAIEDSQPDVIQQILMDFADAIAEAEEKAILAGDTTHLATAPTPDAATEANWYVRDPRLAFDGIFYIASTADAATPVAAGGGEFSTEFVNKAIYNLGKYGRNKGNLFGLVPSDQAANIRANEKFRKANETGLALASFVNGMGSAGEADAIVTTIYGVKMYEAPFAPAGEVVIMHKNAAEMGDRRKIKFKSAEVIESDQRKYVTSERVSFNYNYKDMLVLIDNLSQTIIT